MNEKIHYHPEKIDSKEKEKKLSGIDLRVDFIRHGQAYYTDQEIMTGKIEGSLTDRGIEQIKDLADRTAKEIDKNKEIVVIWSSPKARAQQSAEIFERKLKEEGTLVLKNIIRVSLKDVSVTPEFIKELINKKAINDWMDYWSKSEELPQDVEKPGEVKKRSERVIAYLERIARKIYPKESRKLHFICIGHEKVIRNLLEKAYNLGIHKGISLEHGEALRLDINKSTKNKNAILNLKYRGEKAKLGFNKNQRRFYQLDDEKN